ncbi:MAG: hypothetical protein AMXMBFR34_31120 [Myxococcaceae bacterium]
MSAIRTGGEIDAFCSKCELNLAHTIIAMVGPKVVKVKCNTCGNDHQYRGEQPLVKSQSFANPKKRAASSSSAGPKPSRAHVAWEDKFKGKDLSRARKYSVKDTYALDDVIDHPTFGLGLVTAVRQDKVEVSFKQEEKVLVHGKGAPAAPLPHPPHRPPPSAPEDHRPEKETPVAPPPADSAPQR